MTRNRLMLIFAVCGLFATVSAVASEFERAVQGDGVLGAVHFVSSPVGPSLQSVPSAKAFAVLERFHKPPCRERHRKVNQFATICYAPRSTTRLGFQARSDCSTVAAKHCNPAHAYVNLAKRYRWPTDGSSAPLYSSIYCATVRLLI